MTDNTTASADAVPPELLTLINRVKEGTSLVEAKNYDPTTSNLLNDLNSLWMEAKGNGKFTFRYIPHSQMLLRDTSGMACPFNW